MTVGFLVTFLTKVLLASVTQFGWETTSRESPGCFKFFPFHNCWGHGAPGNTQSFRNIFMPLSWSLHRHNSIADVYRLLKGSMLNTVDVLLIISTLSASLCSAYPALLCVTGWFWTRGSLIASIKISSFDCPCAFFLVSLPSATLLVKRTIQIKWFNV